MADEGFAPLPGARRRGRPAKAATAIRDEWTVIVPVPKNAPAPAAEHYKRGKPSARWTYTDRSGSTLGYVCRFDLAEGGKEFLPLTFCQNRQSKLEWRWRSWDTPRPLYGLDRLAKRPKATVIIAEGEKAADAAAQLLPGYVCSTSPNGSQAAAHADWSVLAKRDVIIWPDADEAGRRYAETVARLLAPIAASIKVIAPPARVVEGWDATDALADGGWHDAKAVAQGFDSPRAQALVKDAAEWGKSADKAADRGSRRRRDGDGDSAAAPRVRGQKGELLKLIAGAELWHAPDMTAYITLQVGEHRENWPVRSKTFRVWLAHRFFEATGATPGGQATEDALRAIEGAAIFKGAQYVPWLRVASHGGNIYLDLGDATWRAVRVTAHGWEVIAAPPIKFVRSRSMLPLPEPEIGGGIELLYDMINVQTIGDQRMIVAFLVGSLNPRGPYPLLALSGTQGAAKTTLSRVLRYMIDPHELQDRGPPRDEQTLIVSARNSWISAFDNLSDMPVWFQDALCRMSTGGGFSSRELYTDFDEVVIHVTRPVVLTAIEDIATRGDLADRTIHVKLPALEETQRITEAEFWAKVEERRPLILGALLDAVASALRHADMRPAVLTRMADFCAFVYAASPGLGWDPERFLEAYLANRGTAIDTVLDASPIGRALMRLIGDRRDAATGVVIPGKNWCGTATALLNQLPVEDSVRNGRSWPAANKVRGRLDRLAPALKAKGIDIGYGETRDAAHEKRIIIRKRGRDDPPDWPLLSEKP